MCVLQDKSKPGLPLVVEVTTSEGKDLSQFLIDAGFAVKLGLQPVSPEDQDLSAKSSVHHQSPPKATQSFPASKQSPTKAGQSMPTSELTPDHADSQTCMPSDKPSPRESVKSGGDCPSQSFGSAVQTTSAEPSSESHHVLSQSVVQASDDAIPPAFPHPCGYGSWVGDADVSRTGAVPCRIPKRKVCSINSCFH